MPVSSESAGFFVVAHEVLAPPEALHAWTFEPWIVASLAVAVAIYAAGLQRAWKSAGFGRGIRVWQAAAFAAGCAAIVAALISPLDAISASLFSAHMAQHELLMVVAAPLLVLGTPLLAALWSLPSRFRKPIADRVQSNGVRRAWRFATAPVTVWLLHAAALWAWHDPALYQAALSSEGIHALQHICFFATAALFWWGLAHGRYGRLGYGAAVVYVFSTAMHSGVLGALLTLSPSLWYPAYAGTAAAWGLTPLEDQQLAGLIMWVPAGILFAVVGLLFFAAWIRSSERWADLPTRRPGHSRS